MSYLELKVPPLALWVVAVVLIAAGTRWFPSGLSSSPASRMVAIVVALVGIGVAVAGVLEFKRAKTTVNPLVPNKATSVVTSGIFRLTRNPMYLGLAATLLGVTIWWLSIVGVAVVVAFCLYLTRFQIQPEERALRAQFGQEFTEYMARVRRWL
ncbi:MAG: isoprenylcysteine carboxylmethyltransferase family protein [Nitrospiraceae bacterium]